MQIEQMVSEFEAIQVFAELVSNSVSSEKHGRKKLDALQQAVKLSDYYRSQGIDENLIRVIFRKRAEMIRQATTVAQLDLIVQPKPPHYNGNQFQPANEYAIPEEEMILWSITSLKAPLNHAGFERYMELFCQFYGALPGEPGFKGVR